MRLYRLATLSDFDSVLDIENECFKEPYSKDDLMYEFTKNPVNKIVVCEEDSNVVGFIDFLITFNSATIMQIAVKGNCRRNGIGLELMKKMEEEFPTENIDDKVETVTLEVRESNLAAIELYKKTGYEYVTLKKSYYKDGENAVYMLKRL